MKSKEDFYSEVRKIRTILKDPENLKCSCPKKSCEWHGNCLECVAIHRYFKDHIPNCFQQFMSEKVRAVSNLVEMDATTKEKTPSEYWDYVRAQDTKSK